MNLGIDYLGGANYGKVIRENHPSGFGAGFILNTNKPHWPKVNAWPVIEALANSGSCPFIRVHAIWEDNHIYDPKKHDKIISQEAAHTAAMQKQFTRTQFYFSPFCERDNDHAGFNALMKSLSGIHSDFYIVNCVHKAKFMSGETINEVHGSKAGPKGESRHAYSYDGTPSVDSNVVGNIRTRNGAEYFMFWTSQMNGKWNVKPPGSKGADKTPRPNRKAWAYPELIQSLGAYRDYGQVVDTIGPKRIWKTHADQHQPKRAAREGKPVLICKDAGPVVSILDSKGNEVARMKRESEEYADGSGRKMYRLGMFGYQLSNLARDKSGSPIVQLVGSNKIALGQIHPAFRAGSFR